MRIRAVFLATLLAATSAHAQKGGDHGDNIVMSVSVKAAPQRVYRASREALSTMGYDFRALLLDQAIITLPHTDRETQALGADAVAVQMELEPHGDSTRITVGSVALRRDQTPCRGAACEKLDAASLLASTLAIDAILKAVEAAPLPRPSRGDSLAAAGAYGYSRENPVRVGGGLDDGAASEHRFLDALRGPGGEVVTYVRLGSCCEHPSPHGPQGKGVLDAYEVTFPGLPSPVVLYIDMYEMEAIRPVDGFAPTAPAPRAETTR